MNETLLRKKPVMTARAVHVTVRIQLLVVSIRQVFKSKPFCSSFRWRGT